MPPGERVSSKPLEVGQTWWLPDGPFLRRYTVAEIGEEFVRLRFEDDAYATRKTFEQPRAYCGEQPPPGWEDGAKRPALKLVVEGEGEA